MSDEPQQVLVVGGGVVGAMCAWYLRQAGTDVTLIDKGKFGSGCSHANCGYVSPSHVFPLPGPGAIRKSLKGMFSSNHALCIRWRLDPGMWMWLLKFASRCNAEDRLQAGAGRHALLQSSALLYRELIASQNLRCDWTTEGLLFVFRDQKNFDAYAETDRLLREHFNVPAEPLDGKSLVEREPALKDGLAGAWNYTVDAHLRPDRLMSEMQRLLTDAGVKIIEDCELRSIRAETDKAVGAVTSAGDMDAQGIVIATGAWTPLLNDRLGCRIPIQPGKGYSITMTRPGLCPAGPMILEECHVGITPFADGYRIGSTMEFAGYDSRMNQQRLAYLRRGAGDFLRDPYGETVQEEWFGWRPMTWDGLPYIDRTPKYRNVWVAAGHNMLGLSMATGTGKLIMEMITGRPRHLETAPYRIGRK